jgi:hypothetical protein
MVNKRGFLRIAEAGIAVLIVLSAILINFSDIRTQSNPDFSENARDLLNEIANNEHMRTEIINNQNYTVSVTKFIEENLPGFLDFELRACDVGSACGQSSYVGEVYSAERIISSDLNNLDPVKLRLFLWLN